MEMDRIHYFFNNLSFRTDRYLENLSAEDIESFRYLHFNIENRIDTKIFYIDFSTYRRLTTEQKKIHRPDKRRRKRDKNFTCQQNQIFRL